MLPAPSTENTVFLLHMPVPPVTSVSAGRSMLAPPLAENTVLPLQALVPPITSVRLPRST